MAIVDYTGNLMFKALELSRTQLTLEKRILNVCQVLAPDFKNFDHALNAHIVNHDDVHTYQRAT